MFIAILIALSLSAFPPKSAMPLRAQPLCLSMPRGERPFAKSDPDDVSRLIFTKPGKFSLRASYTILSKTPRADYDKNPPLLLLLVTRPDNAPIAAGDVQRHPETNLRLSDTETLHELFTEIVLRPGDSVQMCASQNPGAQVADKVYLDLSDKTKLRISVTPKDGPEETLSL